MRHVRANVEFVNTICTNRKVHLFFHILNQFIWVYYSKMRRRTSKLSNFSDGNRHVQALSVIGRVLSIDIDNYRNSKGAKWSANVYQLAVRYWHDLSENRRTGRTVHLYEITSTRIVTSILTLREERPAESYPTCFCEVYLIIRTRIREACSTNTRY